MVRIWLAATALALMTTTTGCTVLGAAAGTGVGLGTPRYTTVGPKERLPSTSSEVEVRVASRDRREQWIKGVYVGVCDGALIVSNTSGEHAIALGEILELRVREGTYVGAGLGAGLAIGAVIDAIVVAIILSNFDPR